MEELVALVSQKTGLSTDQSAAAVKVVLDFVKSKLPKPIADEVDAVLSGAASGLFGDAAKALEDGKLDGNEVSKLFGDLLGGKK